MPCEMCGKSWFVVGVLILVGHPSSLGMSSIMRQDSPRISCDSNLAQIVKACVTYQETNGDYFPAFMQCCSEGQSNPNIPASGQGSDNTFQPMPSLAVLYPAYVDNVKIFWLARRRLISRKSPPVTTMAPGTPASGSSWIRTQTGTDHR